MKSLACARRLAEVEAQHVREGRGGSSEGLAEIDSRDGHAAVAGGREADVAQGRKRRRVAERRQARGRVEPVTRGKSEVNLPHIPPDSGGICMGVD